MMDIKNWVEVTPWVEISECLDESDGTMVELVAAYLKLKNDVIMPYEQRCLHFFNEFELMLEAARDLHNVQSASNDACPTCNDNGMACTACASTGKRLRLAA